MIQSKVVAKRPFKGYIERQYKKNSNDIDIFILFDGKHNFVEKNINYNHLHKKLYSL